MTIKTTINRLCRMILPMGIAIGLLFAGTDTVFAADDFSIVIHQIESRYHAHRNFRFLMGFAGLTAKAWRGAGVKDVKIALFEDQQVMQAAPDREIEELMQSLGESGWRPMLKSVSHRSSGEHTYVYAKPMGKDLRLLLVNVEANEAVVMQVKLDSHRLQQFINSHWAGAHHHHTRESNAGESD